METDNKLSTACPVVLEYFSALQKWINSGPQNDSLTQRYFKVITSEVDEKVSRRRACFLADTAVKELPAMVLGALEGYMEILKALPLIVDAQSAKVSSDVLDVISGNYYHRFLNYAAEITGTCSAASAAAKCIMEGRYPETARCVSRAAWYSIRSYDCEHHTGNYGTAARKSIEILDRVLMIVE